MMEVDCEDIRRSWRWIVEKSEDGADVRGDIPGWRRSCLKSPGFQAGLFFEDS